MDESILYAILQLRGLRWLDLSMIILSWLGNNGLIWCVIAAVLLLRRKTRYSGLFCAAALLLSFLLCNLLLKNLVARPRPYEVLAFVHPLVPLLKDFSFPSGHASASFAAAMAFAYSGQNKKWVIPLFALAILISISRLYVGMHYPSDVLAGLFLGLFCAWVIRRIKWFQNKERFNK